MLLQKDQYNATSNEQATVLDEKEILKMNIVQLEEQLYHAYKRIADLISEKDATSH
jgi:hypothetical protein